MDLDQQIQALIDNAPQDGTTPQVVEAIAPALLLLAQQLRHLHYYILQSLDGNWVITTLSNRTRPTLEKQVIYAFPTSKDASRAASPSATPPVVTPVPVIHILFQMVAMEILDSIVFFETPGNVEVGSEVKRSDVQNLVRVQLERYQSSLRAKSRNIPPDIA